KTPAQVLLSMWALHRVGALKDGMLAEAADHPDALVRTHGMRVLSETSEKDWTAPRRELALRGLKDGDPFVRRAAADAVGQHAGAPTGGLKKWGAELAERLLAAAGPDADSWVRSPLPGKESSPSPWFIQMRASADGNKAAPFWCSLPTGGEQLTGVIRSQ